MKKFLSTICMLVILGFTVPAHVMADKDDNTSVKTEKEKVIEMRSNEKEKIMEKRESTKVRIQANKVKAEINRKDFRSENAEEIKNIKVSLWEEQKAELAVLREELKVEMNDLKVRLEAASTDEQKEGIKDNIQNLMEEHYQAVEEIVWEGEIKDIIEKRKTVFNENQNLREESKEMRREYLEVKKDTVQKYKKAFISRLENVIDELSDEKLVEVNDRIDSMIERTDSNVNISDEQKETLLSALVALKEIIEEKLQSDVMQDDAMQVIEWLLE